MLSSGGIKPFLKGRTPSTVRMCNALSVLGFRPANHNVYKCSANPRPRVGLRFQDILPLRGFCLDYPVKFSVYPDYTLAITEFTS